MRLRGEGLSKKRIAAQLGLDPKTVRRCLRAAATAGVRVRATITDEEVRQVLLALHPAGSRPRGDGCARCLDRRPAIGIRGDVGGKDFDRNRPIEAGVAGSVNLAHAPGADEGEDFV